MKKAHQQYHVEASEWRKSQALVLRAATAHPLPNKFVAKAAVQEKVAIEAARVMKEKMAVETDAAEKALDMKVYKVCACTSFLFVCGVLTLCPRSCRSSALTPSRQGKCSTRRTIMLNRSPSTNRN
jgi:hypothetical protein